MHRNNIRWLAQASLLAAVTAILAWFVVPLPVGPVPVSGQSLGVMLTGLLLPWRWAGVSQAIYLGLGLIGLPVFAGGGAGIGIVLGPTGGYLLGFLLGAPVTAELSARLARWRTIGTATAVLLGCVVLVHGLGVLQLAFVTGISLRQAIVIGTVPFLPGDLVKVVLATVLSGRLRRLGISGLDHTAF